MRRKISFIWAICFLSFLGSPLAGETISLEFREPEKANISGFERLASLHFLPLEPAGENMASVKLPVSGDISVNVFCAGEEYQISLCSGKGKDKICLPPKDAGPLWYPQFASFKIPWADNVERTIQIKPGGGENPKWIAYRFADIACGELKIDSEIYDFALYSQKEDGKFDDLEKIVFLLDLDKDGELLYSKDRRYPGYEIVEIAQALQLGKSAFQLSPAPDGLKVKLTAAKKGLPLTTGLVGSFAPHLALKDLDGNDTLLFQSKAVFLYFFDSARHDQRYLFKNLKPAFDYFIEGGKAENIELVGVSLNSDILSAKSYARENSLPGRIFFAGNGWESEIAKVYHIKGLHDCRLIGADQKFWPTEAFWKRDEMSEQVFSFVSNPGSKEAQEYLKKESLKAGFMVRIALYMGLGEVERAIKSLNELLESQPELRESQMYEHLNKWLETEDFEELSL